MDFCDHPDIFVINTCSVTENADKKCRKIVKEARKISDHAFITIIGCYAQLKPKEIAEIPGVNAVLGAAEKFRLLDILDDFTKNGKPVVMTSEVKHVNEFHNSFSINDRTRTFLKIQDGCNYHCTFCTIPLARGKSRSDSIDNILSSVKEIAKTDVKEIVLTGVNTGDFGIVNGKRKENFINLIKKLDGIDGIDRFRISSIEPNLLSNNIIEFVANSKKFVPHFHIPLQSGSDKILQLMRRKYTRLLYEDRIRTIKSLIPHCCIGADVIVGFPGESENDFLETYRFINELDISYLHVFPYSERANTEAIKMDNVVPMKTRNKRSKMLRILSEKKRRKFYEENIGNEAEILFENDIEEGKMHGFTENYIRVEARYDPVMINETKRVVLSGISEKGFMTVREVEELVTV